MIESQRPRHYREAHLLLGIALLALLVRLVFSFVLFPRLAGPLGLGSDPDLYGQLAQNWVDGKGYTFHDGAGPTTGRGPGYPLLLAAVYVIFGSLFPAAVLVQSLIGSLICLVMYCTAKQVFGSWVGYTAALIGALHPLLIWYTPRLRYEPLLTLLLGLVMFWLLRIRDSQSFKDPLLMGLCLGLAALVNQVVIVLPFLLFAALWPVKACKSTLAKQLIVVLLAMAAIVSPWMARNYLVSGLIIPVHSAGVVQFMKGNYEFEHYHEAPLQSMKLDRMGATYVAQLLGRDPAGLDLLETGLDQALLPDALAFLRDEPGKLLAKIAAQMPRFWYLSESPLKSRFLAAIQVALLLPALVGAFHTILTRRGCPLLVIILYFNLVYAATHVEARYSTPIAPYVVILAAAGLRMIFDIIRERRSRRCA